MPVPIDDMHDRIHHFRRASASAELQCLSLRPFVVKWELVKANKFQFFSFCFVFLFFFFFFNKPWIAQGMARIRGTTLLIDIRWNLFFYEYYDDQEYRELKDVAY